MGFHPIKALKLVLTRKKCNKYDYIFSLGYNCEIAFRMVRYFKFEESSIFNWAAVKSMDILIDALNNFEKIGSAGFNPPPPLWKCRASDIFFHGKKNVEDLLNDPELMQQDSEELTSRLQYLKDKFIKILSSEKRKLYIRKVDKEDIDNDILNKIDALHEAMQQLGGKNFDIMIVSEEKYKDLFKNTDGFIYRTVTEFPPDTYAVSPDFFNNGWNEIFDEFYVSKPKHAKKKKYKFD